MVSKLQQNFPVIISRQPRDFPDIGNVLRNLIDPFEEFRRRVAAALNANADILDALITTEIIRKTSDEVVNNSTTLQDDDELSFAIAANEVLHAKAVIIYDTATVADLKFAFSMPSGGIARGSLVGLATAAAASTDVLITLISEAGLAVGGRGVASFDAINMDLLFVNGGTAGNVVFQWAQNTADVSDTTVRDRSTIVLDRPPAS